MGRSRSSTAWIVAAVAAVVVTISVVLIVVSLSRDAPTRSVPSTSTTSPARPQDELPTTAPEDTSTTAPAEVDESEESVDVAGTERTYLVVAPRGIGADERLPVVFFLHGLGVNARAASWTADWRHAIEDERFLAVFPQGFADSWNMGPCCPPANLVGADDVGYLDAVSAAVAARADVDEERMFMTGFSNGAIMTYAFACARPGVLAAIAPMSGSNLGGCFPEVPISVLHQHGDPDFVVPYDGGPSIGRLLSAEDFPDVPGSLRLWAERAGCAPDPSTTTDADGIDHLEWSDCRDDVRVQLVRVPDRGHNWLDQGDHDALVTILRFFGIS